MVPFASGDQPGVVVGGDGVDHVRIDGVVAGQVEALRDDRAHVVDAVGAVECGVAGDDLRFDVGRKRG